MDRQPITTADPNADPATEPTVDPAADPDHGTQLTTADIAGTDRPQSTQAPVQRPPMTATSQDPSRAATSTPTTGGRPTPAAGEDGITPLFEPSMARNFQERWQSIQVEFVDAPRGAVEKADALVAEVMRYLAQSFDRERKDLEGRWTQGEGSSTEDLRQAIRRYRSFFDRLLNV